MDESDILKNMAKVLGPEAESVLKELEAKEEKKRREQKLLEALNKLVSDNKEHEEVIKQEIEETIEAVNVELVQEDLQQLPQIPVRDIVTPGVVALSVAPQQDVQKVADAIPNALRKELDIIKKSVADFHRFAQRHSQMGGGGEVNLRYLDDVDRSTILQGRFLTYNNSSKKFVFSQIAEGNVDLTHIDQDLTPGANGAHNIGSPSNYWVNVYTDSLVLDGGIYANGSFGSPNQVLTSNGQAAYWNTVQLDRLTASNYEVILATTGQLNLPSANNAESNNARLQSAANIDILANNALWTFGTNGVLTLPDHGKIIFNTSNPEQYIEGTMGFHIHASDAVSIDVGANTWSFDNEGNLTLPAGGDILDSGGNSVLGTDWLHVPSSIIPNTTFTYNLGNTAYSWANAYVQSATFGDNTTQNTAYIPPSFISTAFNGANVPYTSTTTAYIVPIGSAVDGSRNITLGSNNTFVIGKSGKFIINYSIQYKNDGADNADVYVWINKNNSPVEDTSTVFSIPHKKSSNDSGKMVAITPLSFTANTGDTIQIMAASPDDTTVTMITIPAGTTPTTPRTPAVIAIINEID